MVLKIADLSFRAMGTREPTHKMLGKGVNQESCIQPNRLSERATSGHSSINESEGACRWQPCPQYTQGQRERRLGVPVLPDGKDAAQNR